MFSFRKYMFPFQSVFFDSGKVFAASLPSCCSINNRRVIIMMTASSNDQGTNIPQKPDHLTRTSDNTREVGLHPMVVSKFQSISPTVREIVLLTMSPRSSPPSFTFKAGQWVDVFIPGIETVGGFSMCSSPQELELFGKLRLAVKYSAHPPAHWMHNNCRVGDKLHIRVGGDFYFRHDKGIELKHILLIAGGVGINPLCSIFMNIQVLKDEGLINPKTRVCLLYSAKSENELIFKGTFTDYSLKTDHTIVKYFVTGQPLPVPLKNVTEQRIDMAELKLALASLNCSGVTAAPVDAYICGPPTMTEKIKDDLQSLNVRNIYYEQWW